MLSQLLTMRLEEMEARRCFGGNREAFLRIGSRYGEEARRHIAKRQKELVEAVAYLRTSSGANVGTDKDSEKRQRAAVGGFAKHGGFTIVGEFYDAAVFGAGRIDDNGVRTVIVEDLSRFARDMKAQVLGLALLRERGVRLLASSGQDL